MNKLANARSDPVCAEKYSNVSCWFLQAINPFSHVFSGSLFLEIAKGLFFEGKAISPTAISCIFGRFYRGQRNIPPCHFVYTGAAPYRAAQGEIQKKPPRWQPRGYDTQFFRPLVQEEEVSSRVRLPVQRLRVNSILPRQLAIG